jgi:hypothetical protein
VLSTRFFIFQYGVVYALNAAGNDKSFRVSKYSEMFMLFIHLYLFTDTRIIIAALLIDKHHSTYAHTKATLKSLKANVRPIYTISRSPHQIFKSSFSYIWVSNCGLYNI